jgi:hypothetical protein
LKLLSEGRKFLFPQPLYPELRRGVRQRGLNVRCFLVGNILGKTGLGQPAGLLGLGFVNVVRFNCHVGENGNPVAGDLHKAVADGEENRVLALLRDDFASHELGHQRHVLWQNAHLAIRAGQRDHVHVVGENLRLRRDDFEFDRGHLLFVKLLNRKSVGRFNDATNHVTLL